MIKSENVATLVRALDKMDDNKNHEAGKYVQFERQVS